MPRNGYHLLEALLPLLERYENVGGNPHLPDFLRWAMHLASNPSPEQRDGVAATAEAGSLPSINTESMIFRHVVQLYRRVKRDTKLASDGLPVNHLDEFALLMDVNFHPGVRKNDLVTHHLLETSSGNDMVNRLIRAGWLREEADRRFRRLYITEAGRELAFELGARYRLVTATMAESLEPQQREQLLHLLQSLDGKPKY